MQSIDLKKGLNMSKAATLGLAVAALTACGGGGGSDGSVGSTGSNALGTPISESEFLDGIARSGVWRGDIEGELFFTYDFGSGVNGALDAYFTDSSIVSWDVQSNTVVSEDACDLGPTEIYDLSDEDYEDFFDSSSIADCTVNTTFYQVNSSAYALESICGENSVQVIFNQLTSVPEFDHGSVVFTLDSYDNLAVNSGVCGSMSRYVDDFKVTPQPNTFGIEDEYYVGSSINLVAPYSGSEIELEIDFGHELQVGEFNVPAVDLSITSDQFGSGGFETIYATSGTITISSVSTYAVSGTYDVILEDGNTLVGNFSLNLD